MQNRIFDKWLQRNLWDQIVQNLIIYISLILNPSLKAHLLNSQIRLTQSKFLTYRDDILPIA